MTKITELTPIDHSKCNTQNLSIETADDIAYLYYYCTDHDVYFKTVVQTDTEPTPDTELDEILDNYRRGVDRQTGQFYSQANAMSDLIAWSNKRTRDIAEQVIGEDEPGKSTSDLGSEFSTPRDYRRSARNYLRTEQREALNTLLGEEL